MNMHVESHPFPYRHWIVSDVLADPWAAAAAVPAPDWPNWIRYSNDCEKGKRTTRELSDGMRPVVELLLSPDWLGELRELTGVHLRADPTFYGGGIHVTDPGGWLQPHLDFALHESGLERRINLVLFLNAVWKEEWGGAFELWDGSARQCVKRVFPSFNTALIWESSDTAYHATQRTTANALPRLTFAAYYLAQPRSGTTRRRALFVPNR